MQVLHCTASLNMFVSSLGDQLPSFEGHKILLPCISVGNVGQLTVDLVINTLQLPRVGYLDHPAILPLVGNDAFDHTPSSGFLHTSAEVYHSPDLKLVAVQIRTPLIKSLRNDFCVKLLKWVKEAGLAEVVVLTSSHAHERRDSQITGDQFRFLLSPLAADLCPHFKERLKWRVLEPRPTTSYHEDEATPPPSASEDGVLSDDSVFLPGSGLARHLYREGQLVGVRLVVMVAFCIQGDNIQDAITMAGRLHSWMDINQKAKTLSSGQEWICPSSWSLMYGGPSPLNLF